MSKFAIFTKNTSSIFDSEGLPYCCVLNNTIILAAVSAYFLCDANR